MFQYKTLILYKHIIYLLAQYIISAILNDFIFDFRIVSGVVSY